MKPHHQRGLVDFFSFTKNVLMCCEMPLPVLRNGVSVQLSSDLQTVETLHPTDGFGQHLGRLHGGHLSTGLGQVAEVTQPRLHGKREKVSRAINGWRNEPLSNGWTAPEELKRKAEIATRCFPWALPHSWFLIPPLWHSGKGGEKPKNQKTKKQNST